MLAVAYNRCGAKKFVGKTNTFFLTWLAYAIVSASRLCFAIAKNPLSKSDNHPGWAPFNGSNSDQLLGYIDASFMAAYTIFMPLMGRVADRVHIGYFLGGMMIVCAGFLTLFGLGDAWKIHSLPYFLLVTFGAGVAQSAAYPCALAPLSNWFGKTNMGRTLGIWASCSPVGNVIGKMLCTFCLVTWGWPAIFYVPAIVVIVVGLIVILFLVPDPYQIGLLRPGEARTLTTRSDSATVEDLIRERTQETIEEEMVPLGSLLRLPNLLAYCFALFFAKLVFYFFSNWLPRYLHDSCGFDQGTAGYLSTLFDWGGFIGGLLGGWMSDKIGSRGVVCAGFQALACGFMYFYVLTAPTAGLGGNIASLFILGAFVSTPYNLITSCAGVDLGRHPLLLGNSKAKATIIGILDGTGSFGAFIQGPLVGFVKTRGGWNPVFYVMIGISIFSTAMMIFPALSELKSHRMSTATPPAQNPQDANSGHAVSLQPAAEEPDGKSSA